jgi:hypothetical protein
LRARAAKAVTGINGFSSHKVIESIGLCAGFNEEVINLIVLQLGENYDEYHHINH